MFPRFQKFLFLIHRTIESVSPKKFMTFVLSVAVLTRLAAILILGDFNEPRFFEYGTIARNIIGGHGYSMYYPPIEPQKFPSPTDYEWHIPPPPTAFTLPGITAIVTGVLWLFGERSFSYFLIYLCMLTASVISLIGLYLTVRIIFSEVTARWSLLLTSLYPVFIYSATTFGGTAYYHATITFGILTIFLLIKKQNFRSAITAGIMSAVWMYFRPEILFMSIFVAFYLWRKTNLKLASIYLTIVVCSAVPWTIRNYYAYNAFIPLTTNTWLNFWRGNNIKSTGGSWNDDGHPNWHDAEIMEKVRSVPQSTRMEIDISHVYRSEAMKYLSEHPFHAVYLLCKKYIMFWTFDFSEPRARNIIYLLSYGTLFITFILGLRKTMIEHRTPVLLLLIIFIYSITVSLLHVETRYQTYVSMLYFPFASYWLLNYIKGHIVPKFGKLS